MKTLSPKLVCFGFISLVILFTTIGFALAQSHKNIRLYHVAFEFASQRIKQGHAINDRKGSWREHRPSANEENEFIKIHGFTEYAQWHLGIDERYPQDTKRRYKFPYGDFKNVHRGGLLAIQARARQYGYGEIEQAAAELERAMDTQSKINVRLR